MATAITEIKVGDKTYYLSQSGEDVYYSTSNRTGGLTLKGVKFRNNQILKKSNNRPMTEFEIAQAIRAS